MGVGTRPTAGKPLRNEWVIFGCGILVGILLRDGLQWQLGFEKSIISRLQADVPTFKDKVRDGGVCSELLEPTPASSWGQSFIQHTSGVRSLAVPVVESSDSQAPVESSDSPDLCMVGQQAAVNGNILLFIGDENVLSAPDNTHTLMYAMMSSVMSLKINNVVLTATTRAGFQNATKWVEHAKSRGVRLHAVLQDIPVPGVLAARQFREQQSAKKFPVIRDLLRCGINVLLSDFDVVFWDDPFKHIVGDADVEGMTDGWDYKSWYGYGEEIKLWPQGPWFNGWEWRTEFLNSGFFFVRASSRTTETMAATWDMLSEQDIWDQAAYNLQVRAPLGALRHRAYAGQGLSIRVMDPLVFPNSRVFQNALDPAGASSMWNPGDGNPFMLSHASFKWPSAAGTPAAMHVNYHKFKVEVMDYARRLFAGGNATA